jgi:hypothetical protein
VETGCIRIGVYLAWKSGNIPARYPSVVLDHDLEVLELGYGDSIERYIEENKCPFEEGVDGICCPVSTNGYARFGVDEHTSGDVVNLMLNEEVDQGYEGRKEATSKELSVLEGCRVAGAQCKAAQSPGQSGDKVRDHENVVPVMGVGGRHICPSTTCQCAENANTGDELGERRVRAAGHNVPQADQCEARTYCMFSRARCS